MISVNDYQNKLNELKRLATTVLKAFEGNAAETFKTNAEIGSVRTRLQIYRSLRAVLTATVEEKKELLTPSAESEVYRKISSALDLRMNVAHFMRAYSSLLGTASEMDARRVYIAFMFQFLEAGIWLELGIDFKVRPFW